MATTKQYNELQDGGSLQSDDKLAVARTGASELLTVPAESLAQRAAEIVSTDQMQEFVADIGLGVLAQALNNKGAGVTAADTLAQMAGKVDALDVVGAKEYIITPIIKPYDTSIATKGYTLRIPDTDFYISADDLSHNTLQLGIYRVEGTGFVNVSSLLLSSSQTSNANPSVCGFIFSKNKNLVAFQYGSEGFVLNVSDDGIISQAGKVTLPNSSMKIAVIKNDAQKMLVVSSSSAYIYTLTEEGQNVSDAIPTGVSFSNIDRTGWCDDDGSNLIILNGETAYGQIKLITGSVDWENNLISVSNNSIQLFRAGTSFKTGDGGIYPIPNKDLLIKFSKESSSDKQGQFVVFNTRSLTVLKNIKVSCLKIKSEDANTIPGNGYSTFYVSTVSENRIKVFSFPFGIIEYDIQTNRAYDFEGNELTGDIDSPYYTALYLASYSNYLGIVCNGSIAISGNFLFGLCSDSSAAVTSCGYSSNLSKIRDAISYYGKFEFVQDKKCFGQFYKRNGKRVIFSPEVVSVEDLETGAYDVENSSAVVQLSGGRPTNDAKKN